MVKTFYITGITGFLGHNFVRNVASEDIKIIGFALPGDRNINLLKSYPNVSIVEGNILNPNDVYNFLNKPGEGQKYLIHIAGKITTVKEGDPSVMEINFNGTKNIVNEAIRHHFEKIIYISSVDSLPRSKGLESIVEPDKYEVEKVVGIYSRSKVLSNNYVLEKCPNGILILPSAIVGPYDTTNSPINAALEKTIRGKFPALTDGGYNLVDVRDVAEAIKLAIEKGKPRTSYIISGENISIKDLISYTAEYAGQKIPKLVVPHSLIKLISPFIEAKAKAKHKTPLFTGFSMDCLKQNSNYSYKKAKEELGYNPRPLKQTLRETIDWLKSRN